ncbi:MAG: WYL domain-containing protein [Flavobacteriales bacterium]|nr:WYL domain-containing protein [Flavobacteriales bacterium]
MAEQRKILRIFKLISLLKGVRRRSPKELADILEISKRTAYRYFILLEELGFVIDVDFEGCYFIPTEEGDEYTFTFNAEESLLIRQSIKSLSASHNLSEHILKKLHMMSEQAQIGENILNASNGLKIEKLSKAIQDKIQVKLLDYSSLNSNTDSTRLFEPITFTTNYTGVIGVDVQKAPDEARIFNINRIGQVELLQKQQKFALEIEVQSIDAFGYKGEKLYDVELKLQRKAYSQLIQFYPQTKPLVKGKTDDYIFAGKVYFSEYLLRFLLAFPDEAHILKPQALKDEFINFKQSLL